MRRDAKADANQPAIVAILKEIGCSVQHLHMVGQGVPDLLVGCMGRTYLVEIKTESGVLTKREAQWHQWWVGDHIHIVRSEAEALEMVGYPDRFHA